MKTDPSKTKPSDVSAEPIRVTIVTPCRNAAGFLDETLRSVAQQSAVLSGRVSLQHLVMDGLSSDETSEIALGFPHVTFTSRQDTGMYDALASGLQEATGDIIGYLNSGDILFPWAFDVLADVFANHRCDWLTGFSTHINDRLQVTAAWKPTRYRREFVCNGRYADPSYPVAIQQESTFWSARLNRLADLEKLSTFRLAGDYFLWTEFARHAELDSVMSQLGGFRIHGGQLSEQSEAYATEVSRCTRGATASERFTVWWESCGPQFFKNSLWRYTLGKPPSRIFEYCHKEGEWMPR